MKGYIWPNLKRSVVFFSSVIGSVINGLRTILPIPVGSLPVKYLGVPLISSWLTYDHCIQLKEKILKKVQCWVNKLLSFGGRAQLIQSVLWSMQVYWCSIFILPPRILKEVEGILKAIPWAGAELKKSGAKVQWLLVCSPKPDGSTIDLVCC